MVKRGMAIRQGKPVLIRILFQATKTPGAPRQVLNGQGNLPQEVMEQDYTLINGACQILSNFIINNHSARSFLKTFYKDGISRDSIKNVG